MSISRTFKAWVVPQLLLGYIFIMSGLIVCGLMALSTVVWLFDRQLYRKINVHLAYAHWSQFTFIAQWWSGTEVYIYMDDEDIKKVGKEHVLVMMNHKYDIDWLMAWILSERFGMLGGTKIFGKEILRYVPLIGWAWYFTESIFLKRQWDHDRKIIQHDVARIVNYPDGYWITVLLFPEGTRFTEEKHRASLEVCRTKGYPLTKHTLLPRTKGFVLSMHGMKGKVPALYNATVGFPTSGPAPTLMNIISGVPLVAHFHVYRVPLEDVPIDSDEECGVWLRKVFQEKDALYDEFLKTDKFPGKGRIIPQRINDLVMWSFWAVLTCVPLFYYIGILFIAGTWLQRLIFVGLVFLMSVGIRLMIQVTETHSGSSYGTQPDKKVKDKVQEPSSSAKGTEADDSKSVKKTD